MARPTPSTLPAQLLEGAREELREVGSDQFSLRSVARRIGVSHQATANHFKDRKGLLTAVATEGFHRFDAALEKALREETHDVAAGDRVAALGIAYLQFAADDRSVFKLMWDDALLDVYDGQLLIARLAVWSRLLSTVTEATRLGWGGGEDPTVLATMAWASVHGLTNLEDGPLRLLPGFFPESEQVLRSVTRTFATVRHDQRG